MPDAQTIALIVSGVLGGIGLWWSGRKLRKAGFGGSSAEAIGNLQILADTWEERYNLEVEARVSAQTALAECKADQVADRRSAARDRADLDNARSKIRTLEAKLERRRLPRADA